MLIVIRLVVIFIKDYGTDVEYTGASITYCQNSYEFIMHTHNNPFNQFIEYSIDITDDPKLN